MDVEATLMTENIKMKSGMKPNGETFEKDDIEEEEDDWDQNQRIESTKSINCLAKGIIFIQSCVGTIYSKLQSWTGGQLFTISFILAYTAFFIMAMVFKFGDEGSIRLLCCTILGIIIAARHFVARNCQALFVNVYGDDRLNQRHMQRLKTLRFFIRWLFYGVLLAMAAWVLMDVGHSNPDSLKSMIGLVMFIVICVLCSTNPGAINWHTVYWGVGLQFLCALLTLKIRLGRDALLWVQDRLDEYFANTEPAAIMLFGESYTDHHFIFGAFPLFLYMNAVVTVLYYLGAMQFIIRVIGNFLSFVLDIQPVEATSVATGIFMEGIMSALTLKPYLSQQSQSQLFVVITSTLSSLGGAYLAILTSLGVKINLVIPAMMVSAPATFAVSKLMVPETRPKDSKLNKSQIVDIDRGPYSNVMEALQGGATSILTLLGNILAIAYTFLSLISWGNNTVEWFADRIGIVNMDMQRLFSYIFYPVTLAMGIESADCQMAATLLGYRVISANMVSFLKMRTLRENRNIFQQYMVATNFTGTFTNQGSDIRLDLANVTLIEGFISERTEAIMTFSLCGFSSLLSVAVILGTFYTLLPKRRPWLSKMMFPALVAGNITNCMTACFAGLFY